VGIAGQVIALGFGPRQSLGGLTVVTAPFAEADARTGRRFEPGVRPWREIDARDFDSGGLV
jgi:hypothetical protein